MPIFEYLCVKCGEKFEVIQKEASGGNCPKCGGVGKRLFSPYNFQFSMFLKELDKGTII